MNDNLGVIKNIVDTLAEVAYDFSFAEMQLKEFFSDPIWKAIELGMAQKLSSAYSVLKDASASMETIRTAQGAVMSIEDFFMIRDTLMQVFEEAKTKEVFVGDVIEELKKGIGDERE